MERFRHTTHQVLLLLDNTMAKNTKKESEKKDLPLGGDYALDAHDNPVVVYEDRSGQRKKGNASEK